MQTPNSDHLQEKWAPLLDAEGQDPIKDPHRRDGYRSSLGKPRKSN